MFRNILSKHFSVISKCIKRPCSVLMKYCQQKWPTNLRKDNYVFSVAKLVDSVLELSAKGHFAFDKTLLKIWAGNLFDLIIYV